MGWSGEPGGEEAGSKMLNRTNAVSIPETISLAKTHAK
jgi:hypothetical protein